MSLRRHLELIKESGAYLTFSEQVSRTYQIAGALKVLEPQPVFFENVADSPFRVVGNLLCTKTAFADYLGVKTGDIIPLLVDAIYGRSEPELVDIAPCQEVVIPDPNLDDIPILKHCDQDGGNYITSGIMVAKHPQFGQNVDFHRCMQFSKTEMAIRVVRSRHFDTFLHDLGQVDVAICIGLAPHVLVAAATSVEIGVDELEIANAIEPLTVVNAKTIDVTIPAECEFVIEGTVYLDRKHAEGPFVDLTGIYDVIRQEPVLEVSTITHRRDAIYQALLPGALEHKLLMGMPREPTIFRKVNQVVKCLDVNVNPGGCSWLHAIVQIDKQEEDDGLRAIEAAFSGHSSCKHVYVVDADIDIYDPLDVEWAMATRFQGDKDLILKSREPGSSLDPSAEPGTKMTTKMGFDLTMPLGGDRGKFEKVRFPMVDNKITGVG